MQDRRVPEGHAADGAKFVGTAGDGADLEATHGLGVPVEVMGMGLNRALGLDADTHGEILLRGQFILTGLGMSIEPKEGKAADTVGIEAADVRLRRRTMVHPKPPTPR